MQDLPLTNLCETAVDLVGVTVRADSAQLSNNLFALFALFSPSWNSIILTFAGRLPSNRSSLTGRCPALTRLRLHHRCSVGRRRLRGSASSVGSIEHLGLGLS